MFADSGGQRHEESVAQEPEKGSGRPSQLAFFAGVYLAAASLIAAGWLRWEESPWSVAAWEMSQHWSVHRGSAGIVHTLRGRDDSGDCGSLQDHPEKAYLMEAATERRCRTGVRVPLLCSGEVRQFLAIAHARLCARRHGTEKRNPYFRKNAFLGTRSSHDPIVRSCESSVSRLHKACHHSVSQTTRWL
jgi:hypothetical protein